RDGNQRLASRYPLPVLGQRRAMYRCPLENQAECLGWQTASEHSQRLDRDRCLMLTVASMEVGSLMLACKLPEHHDHDAVEGADPRHGVKHALGGRPCAVANSEDVCTARALRSDITRYQPVRAITSVGFLQYEAASPGRCGRALATSITVGHHSRHAGYFWASRWLGVHLWPTRSRAGHAEHSGLDIDRRMTADGIGLRGAGGSGHAAQRGPRPHGQRG